MNKKLFIILPVILLISVPVIGFANFTINCQRKYNTVLKQKQPFINEFDKVTLLGEQPPQKTKVERGGDCIDSNPYVTISKSYDTTMGGGRAVDMIRSGLKTAGYTITNEDFGSEGCKLHYRASAHNSDIKIYAVAYQINLKDATCTDGYPTGVSEAHFRAQNIDLIKLGPQN
ncbi:MAG: hypothetical protein ABI220_01255 [Candidatus Saccharimonadales bacterium]